MTPRPEDNARSIGHTSLARLNRVTDTAPATASAKSESNNPACSIACRPGISMIWNAEERGPLSRGKAIAEPTHGLALTAMPDEGRLVAKGKVI